MCWALLAKGGYLILMRVDNHRIHFLPTGRELIKKNNFRVGYVSEHKVGEILKGPKLAKK